MTTLDVKVLHKKRFRYFCTDERPHLPATTGSAAGLYCTTGEIRLHRGAFLSLQSTIVCMFLEETGEPGANRQQEILELNPKPSCSELTAVTPQIF